MKFDKANTEILLEGLHNGITFTGRKGRKLIGTFIGTIEVKLCWGIDGYYPAVKLPTGEILGVSKDNKVFSLAGLIFSIHWGEYYPTFPDNLKTKVECPKTLKIMSHQEIYSPVAKFTNEDELPF